MRIGSTLENQNIEKRIAITPEIVKKYNSLGLEVCLIENYGSHLGIKDQELHLDAWDITRIVFLGSRKQSDSCLIVSHDI